MRTVSTAGFGAGDPRPKNLAEIVEGYNAEGVKRRLRGWEADQPVGKEGFRSPMPADQLPSRARPRGWW